MAIDSFTTLQTAVTAWMYEQAALTSNFPTFVQLAEARFNNGADGAFPTEPLRTSDMETTDSLTLVDGAADLPEDFLAMKGETAESDPRLSLNYASPKYLNENYGGAVSGSPYDFTIIGNQVIVRNTTDSTIEIVYYAKIPPLTEAEPSNWLIVKAPNVYLWGVCLEAAMFNGDATRINEAGAAIQSYLGPLGRTEANKRAGSFAMRPSVGLVRP